ncbi:polyribonucleotide nucleotidyltransferase [Candidatus Parcubacteria bacterium]|nr:MAG: polyribonucleotide nucleotidyltransferase [Candidatus Parcubacteria bacterium]
MKNENVFSCEWLGRTLTIKTGKLAKQADSAVTVQYGDTVVLATVVQAKYEREGVDFFPLMVEFEEKLYAAGIIKGSQWVKREGRPSDESVLTGRMIDRSIRPLFDDSVRKDIQVVLTTLSVDQENDYDIVGLIAASAALSISGADWKGPIGGIRVGIMEDKFVFNPTYEQRENSSLDLIVAGTEEKTLMIEAGGKEVKEDLMYEAILAGQKELKPVIDLIKEMASKVEIKKHEEKEQKKNVDEQEAEKEKEELLKKAEAWLGQNVNQILFNKEYYTKGERKLAVEAIKDQLDEYLFSEGIGSDHRKFAIGKTVQKAIDTEITKEIIENKRRVDGRDIEDIRNLEADVDILPRNHGAGLFSRGETQVLTVATLGAAGLAQSLEGLEGNSKKTFMHHYNFPAFSVGETRPNRGTSRRDIGHGALAEKALEPMMPSKEDFPYTIRLVSETLGSNGSSSMGATCASTLACMHAGIPIKKPVAGIAIGLASYPDMSSWQVITDIQDLEDGKGGMDFKVTGTEDGITAIQLDTKTDGLNAEIVKEALRQAKTARLKILKVITDTIPEPNKDLSPYAPRITSFHIDPEKIREVIGTGGKVINEIIDVCDVQIDIEDDGLVMVCGNDAEGAAKAVKWIQDIVREIEAGEIFTGKVVRMLDFGAFVELLPGRDGMVHVSEMAPYRVGKPSDFVSEGDVVTVRVKEIDDQGRVNLTMKGLKENEDLWKEEKGKQVGGFGGNGGNGGFRKKFNNGDRPKRNFKRQ